MEDRWWCCTARNGRRSIESGESAPFRAVATRMSRGTLAHPPSPAVEQGHARISNAWNRERQLCVLSSYLKALRPEIDRNHVSARRTSDCSEFPSVKPKSRPRQDPGRSAFQSMEAGSDVPRFVDGAEDVVGHCSEQRFLAVVGVTIAVEVIQQAVSRTAVHGQQ